MTDIKSMNQAEMADYFRALGEPAFRAKQVFQWLHRGAVSFDEMTNLSKGLREKLSASCYYHSPCGGAQAGLRPGRDHQISLAAAGRKLH